MPEDPSSNRVSPFSVLFALITLAIVSSPLGTRIVLPENVGKGGL
jgi:hypothetical protein